MYYKASLREMTFAGGDTFDNDRQIDGRRAVKTILRIVKYVT